MDDDLKLLRRFRIFRLQRSIEYVLLISIFFFFLLAFSGYYRPLIIFPFAFVFFGLNLQLTLQRERRRVRSNRDRSRVMTDMIESFLFLGLILILSIPGVTRALFGANDREHYALIAAILTGIFLGGLVGEMWFQLRIYPRLEADRQRNYIRNLKRTIVLPYIASRRTD